MHTRRNLSSVRNMTLSSFYQARGQAGPAKSKKQKGNAGATNVEEDMSAHDDDASMDIESEDVNIRETEGLAKRIEDTVVIDDTEGGSVESAPAELEPQVRICYRPSLSWCLLLEISIYGRIFLASPLSDEAKY